MKACQGLVFTRCEAGDHGQSKRGGFSDEIETSRKTLVAHVWIRNAHQPSQPPRDLLPPPTHALPEPPLPPVASGSFADSALDRGSEKRDRFRKRGRRRRGKGAGVASGYFGLWCGGLVGRCIGGCLAGAALLTSETPLARSALMASSLSSGQAMGEVVARATR